MSQALIGRSPDLSKLRADGYDITTRGTFLLVRDVPYLNSAREIVRGTLVKALTLSGDIADYQGDHTIFLAGPTPHDASGAPLASVINSSNQQEPLPGVVVDHILSKKPPKGYTDYYELVTTYVALLSKHVASVDESATARTYPAVTPDTEDNSPFVYLDTASGRAGIAAVNDKVIGQRVAIIGLGGTGAYILDLIAKSPIAEIHLFDGDVLMQHNAFRYPGAIPFDVVAAKPHKATYFAERYADFRHGVIAHPIYVSEETVGDLKGFDFVFLAIDDNPSRATITAYLDAINTSYIDVGMGLFVANDTIGGQLRISSILPSYREQFGDDRKRLPTRARGENIYDQNIQIVDLNALNACLAVGRWKRYVGIYTDLSHEHHTVYTVDGNTTINEDR